MHNTLKQKPTSKSIPRSLVYEEMDSEPIYYRGYQEVVSKQKTLDDILGSGSLQVAIIRVLLKYAYAEIDGDQYEVYTNETRLHLSKGNNLAADIAIYRKDAIKDFQYDDRYFKIPPAVAVAVEIDAKADLSVTKWETYLKKKTKKLHGFGVEKVVWILSATQQVIIAEPDQD